VHVAAYFGNLKIMDCLIKCGADVNVLDSDGATPLFYAVSGDKTLAAIHLTENGADVNLCEYGFKGRSPLHAATQYGNLKTMDCLIKAGANVNVQDSDGTTPLFCAVVRDKTEAAIHLIENCADVNLCGGGFKGRTPVHAAAEYGNLKIMVCLIKAETNVNVRDSDGHTPLFCAVARDKTEAAIHLIENGPNVNLCAGRFKGRSPLSAAAQYGNLKIMDSLIKAGANVNVRDSDGAIPLFCAIAKDKTEATIHLTKYGADVNLCESGFKCRSPLLVAAEYGNLKIMESLIKSGANVNVQDSKGTTPLFCAAAEGKTEAVIHLTKNGADVNVCAGGFKGRSPLHAAAEYGDLEILDCLIKSGANVNVQDFDGATPLFSAVAKGKTEAAIHLIENGADVNLRECGFTGRSTLHVAAQHGNLEIMDCLIKSGANVNVRDSDGDTPLSYAFKADKTEAAIHLIENYADVYICEGTFLSFICGSTE
jgi:ankyrin repeat protein